MHALGEQRHLFFSSLWSASFIHPVTRQAPVFYPGSLLGVVVVPARVQKHDRVVLGKEEHVPELGQKLRPAQTSQVPGVIGPRRQNCGNAVFL